MRPAVENSGNRTLKICANSTRPARWDAKLGYCNIKLFTIKLRHIDPEGGYIPCVDIVIVRKYPIEYMETLGDTKVVRSQREENAYDKKYQVLVI